MKAFICLALVACVAARSVDLDTFSNLRLLKEKSLLKDDLLFNRLNRFQQLPKKTFGLDTLETLDTLKNLKVNSWDEHRVSVLSFEEIVQTSLFREYYEIPLFRQYLTQYPVVFRRYIESPLFQQFWTVPQFQQYFRNPIFFYKYIVPQVQIIAQTQQEGIFRPETIGQEEYYPESRQVIVGQYLNRILNSLKYGQEEQYNTLPYATRYNGQVYGRDVYNYNPVNYKFLLDKIYKTLFVNKPVVGEVTEVKTDVKVAPSHEKVVVEPITGETKLVVQEPKIVDVKVDEKVVPRTQVVAELEHEVIVKETLLKKLLLNKKISYEVYTVLKTLPLGQLKEVVRKLIGDYAFVTLVKDIETPYVTRRDFITRELETPFLNRDMETPYMTRDVLETPFYGRDIETPFYGRDIETPFLTNSRRGLDTLSTYGQNIKYDQLVKELINNEITSDRVTPLVRELLNQRNIRDELIRA